MPARPSLAYDQNGNVYQGGPLKRLSTNNFNAAITTTPTFLHTINVTKAGTSWNLKLYDGVDAGGTLIIDMDCNTVGSFQIFGEALTALYAVTSGTTAGSLTISYSDQLSY